MDSFIFSKMFWGVLVVLIGILIIVNAIFNTNLPIFRILLALFFIYLGVKMLLDLRPNKVDSDSVAVFSEGVYEATGLKQKEFSAVFGSQTIDMRHVQFPPRAEIEMNAVFGSSTLLLPGDVRVEVEQNAIFGSVDAKKLGGGSADSPQLEVECNAVFGSIEIIQ